MLKIDLSNRVALVLGGSRGIGAGVVESLCRAGAAVVFTHTGHPQRAGRAAELVERVQSEGGAVEAEIADACDSKSAGRLVETILARHGRIDVLVCNVGQNRPRAAEVTTDEGWRRYMAANLDSAFYGVRAVLPAMLPAEYGRIVLIGSSVVYDGGGGAIDYATGKAGLCGMMAYLTRNYASRGVLTNVVHPCVIETDLLRQRYSDTRKQAALVAQVPVGRLGTPADIGNLVAFLASEFGDFICGQQILVDGGRTLF